MNSPLLPYGFGLFLLLAAALGAIDVRRQRKAGLSWTEIDVLSLAVVIGTAALCFVIGWLVE